MLGQVPAALERVCSVAEWSELPPPPPPLRYDRWSLAGSSTHASPVHRVDPFHAGRIDPSNLPSPALDNDDQGQAPKKQRPKGWEAPRRPVIGQATRPILTRRCALPLVTGTETVAARQQPPTVFATAVGGFRDTKLQRGAHPEVGTVRRGAAVVSRSSASGRGAAGVRPLSRVDPDADRPTASSLDEHGCGCNATLRSDWRHGLHPICAAAARARLSHGAAARRRIQFSSPWPRQLRLHLLHGTRAPQAQPVDEQPGRHRARTRATCAGPAWSTVAPERRCRRSSSRGGVRHTTYSGGAPQNNVASSRLHFARLFHGGQRQPGAARGAGG
jgi:hypothetical protein